MSNPTKRKFLVADLSKLDCERGFPIIQGYLTREAALVKIRTFGGFAFLTVSHLPVSSDQKEFEYPIPMEDAIAMIERYCQPWHIRKTRHLVPHGSYVVEVDVFEGKHAGLVIATIEQKSGVDLPSLPSWIGNEITHDPDFCDLALSHTEWSPNTKGAVFTPIGHAMT